MEKKIPSDGHIFCKKEKKANAFAKAAVLIVLLSAALVGCGDGAQPRPHAYPKVEYPVRQFTAFDTTFCQFTFEQPTYMVVEQDTQYFNQKAPDPCWFNLQIPCFNATIHFTYIPVKTSEDIFKVFDQTYRLASEHNKKADANLDYVFNNAESRVYGRLYEIEGYVASPFQFAVTDSVRHSLRGALYFNTSPEPDSLKPMINFVRRDMLHIMNTIRWK
jgi:gliding motility-associated lipoprotein GldD